MQASKANDAILSTRASNVYFDSTPDGKRVAYSIVNRNKEPVLDVYYTYTLTGGPVAANSFVGLVPACTRVPLGLENGDDKHDSFRPLELYLKDNNGNSWHREEGGRVDQIDHIEYTQPRRNLVASGSAVEGGC